MVEGGSLELPDISTMGSVGVEALRIPLDWSVVESRGPGNGCNATYDWSRYDNIVSEAAGENSGRSVHRGLPALRRLDPHQGPGHGSPAIEDYKCFVRAAVERYGRGGAYLDDDPSARAITDWQVWNEVNLTDYAAKGKPDPKEYARCSS